ncbi:MAG: DUF2235 domain-containing protein [Planctomycetia bacterium]|nr:MAG: DUF2235 domain-containing protein [Planctomycetia bacterium]
MMMVRGLAAANEGLDMRTRNSLPFVLAVVPLLLLVESAQAHFHPGTGQFISRDPYFERGGMNLYAYVENHVTYRTDPLGLKTYVIEGTNAGPGNPLGPCNPQHFGEDDPEGVFVQPGPDDDWGYGNASAGVVFGHGLSERVANTVSQICSDMCSKSPPEQINIVGWSRGAVGALMVVDYLEKHGCCCQTTTVREFTGPVTITSTGPSGPSAEREVCCDRRYPTINFLGLYDPVDMTPRAHPESIPPSVQNCALAIGDQQRNWTSWCTYFGASPRRRETLFPLAKCEPANWDKTKFRRQYFDATHGDIGTGRPADDWMRKCARQAGVNIPEYGPQHVPRPPAGCSGCGAP